MSSLSRRSFLRMGASGTAAGVLGISSHAQVTAPAVPTAPAQSRFGAELINQETEDAIRNGLDFIARSQLANGSFSNRKDGVDSAITALASLALMAGGNQPNRGKHGKELANSVDYVVSLAQGAQPGFLNSLNREGQIPRAWALQPGPMYSHGFCTLFLSEVCGMYPSAARNNRVRTVLEQAVAFTISAQNKEGGWRYDPRPSRADVSVTVAQMMALRAAKHAGILVRKGVIDEGASFIKSCQVSDGGFSYLKSSGGSAFARSAACIVGLYSAGIYEGREIERGLKYLQQFAPGRQFSVREIPPEHYWYGHYYAALAMWTAGDEYWLPWFQAIRDDLLAKRRAGGGNWRDDYVGHVYATAMALIILQLPNNYLPILQK